jgi:hypothetical protein
MSTAPALTLLVLRCADLERARRLYECFGLSFRPEQHAQGPSHYSAVLGHSVLELYPEKDASTRALRLGLVVRELGKALTEATKLGARVLKEDGASVPARAVVQDLDGHTVELVEERGPVVCTVDGSRIVDWDTFHDAFARSLGFPPFYGRNMDAWIDCMSALDSPADGLSSMHVQPGDVLTIELEGVDDFTARCPAIYEALVDCTAFVNWRRCERGAPPVLALSFCKSSRGT